MKNKTKNQLQNDPIPKKKRPPKYCGFCRTTPTYISYKDAQFLTNFLNPQGKILRAVYTGNCRKHQRYVASSIKKARHLAYLPYVVDNLR